MDRFDIKDPSEKRTLTFDFALDLDTGEALSGSPAVTVTAINGTDAAPAAIINGTATLDVSATKVLVPVKGGVASCDYIIRVVINTSNAQKVLVLAAILPVQM